MQPLSQSMNGVRQLADPTKSRLGYRLQRIWLTPLFRALIRTGIPCAIVLLFAISYLQKPDVRVALAQGAVEARDWVHERPEFMVKLMAIEGVSDAVADAVRAEVHIDFPTSSFDLDLVTLRDQIDALAPIKDVAVRIRPGGVLEVSAVERTPALVWRAPDGMKLLDVEGVAVAAIAERAERPELPLVAGEGADQAVQEALQLVQAAAPISERLRGLQRQGARRWDVVLDREQVIQLPEDDPVPALERVILLNDAQDLLARDITHIDLRNPTRPTLRLAQYGLAEMRRIKGIEFGASGQ
ncbi:cell division protein FtsQ/DivIB [Shimia ponticola]|uniref:cell division protein FtsQ/DivIB n=1 Tax=Shimia ponticola TaxID=2582893 RepID=UPI0011BD47E5|nr:cell division protein FtsQ/DivIB [Shimia ponticola]